MPNNNDPNDILVINGPNLNLLGKREPEIYGTDTLDDIEKMLRHVAERHQIRLWCFQSNHEGAIVDKIQEAMDSQNRMEGIIINPGAYTHTSVAIRDTLVVYDAPVIEVHISNIHNREDFRATSLISPVVRGTISGFGIDSYRLALLWMIKHLERE